MTHYSHLKVTHKFPFTIKHQGEPDVIVDRASHEVLPRLHEFYMKFAYSTNGLSEDEFVDKDDFRTKALNRETYYARVSDTDQIVGFLQGYPSPLCRSVKPIYNAGYRVRDPEFGGFMAYALAFSVMHAELLGYKGLIGRAATLNPAVFQRIHRSGGSLLGCIPLSLDIPKAGWTDDLIVFLPYPKWNPNPETIPANPVRRTRQISDSLDIEWASCIEDMEYSSGSSRLRTKVASAEQRAEVEDMIYEAAMAGTSYGLDEFNTDGTYSRKMLRKSITIVLTDHLGGCAGAVLCGSSMLCRSSKAPILAFYIVHNNARNNGRSSSKEASHGIKSDINLALYKTVVALAKHHHCFGIITDILSTDIEALLAAQKHGLTIVGSVPHSAYVKGQGHTDSLIMHQKVMVLSVL